MAQPLARKRPNLLEMLARNPHGWGPEGVASPEEGVRDPAEAERGRNMLAMFGPVAEAAVPYLPQKGREMADEAMAQAPYMAAGPVLGMAARAPRYAAAAAGAMGLTGLSSRAGQGSEGAKQELLKQRASLDRQRATAIEERDGQLKGRDGRKAGRGPIYDEKNREVQRLTDEMSAIDTMIGEENKRSSPEFQMEMQKKAQGLADERKAKEAATPFRQKHPLAAEALAWGGTAAAAALPFLLRGKSNIGSFLPGSQAGRVNRAVKEANAAIDAGNMEKAKRLSLELKQLVGTQPKAAKGKPAAEAKGAIDLMMKAGKSTGKAAGAAGAGGALAAEGSLLPDQLDMGMLPEGPARDRAREAALNPMNYLDRGITGTLTGLAGHKAGALIPAREADVAGARAVIEYMAKAGRKTAKPVKSTGAKRVTRKPRGQAND